MAEQALALDPLEAAQEYVDSLARTIAEEALDRKALGLRVVDVRGLADYADYLVVCSGTSDRHVLAIADAIEGVLRPEKIRPIGIEGRRDGRWVLMDYGDVVVHIFVDAERDVYGIDSLWSDAPSMSIEVPPDLERPAYAY